MDKKDYLKKYLAGGDKKKRKKKVISSSSSVTKSKIIDDDLDLKNMRPLDENELEIYDLAEDAPQVAGIVDDRPEEVRVMSQYRETKKWKIVTREYEDVHVSAVTGSDSDYSPTRVADRKKTRSSSDSDVSVKRKRNDESDVSPPRRKISKENPPVERSRKRKDDSDESPPRKGKRSAADSGSDISPPRRNKKDHGRIDSDTSPPRKKRQGHREKSRWGRSEERSPEKMVKTEKLHGKKEKMTKTLDGKKAGLQNAVDMRSEAAEIRRKQAESLAKLGDDVSGRGAKAIVRDRKTGKRRNLEEEARQKREKDAKNAEIMEKYAVWGKGMKQIDDRAAKMKEEIHEMSKPVARYADDEDLEDMRRNEEREGDPMLEYMRNKRRKEGGGQGNGGKSKPQYQGNYMPNRYNIKPGHKWDGVDRSNGYETKWFEERNARKAQEEEAFKWSTEDM